VFDWNRVGLDDKPRALHVQESMHSIDFTDFAPSVQQIKSDGTLVKCEYFDVKVLSGSKQAGTPGESLTLAVVSGKISVGGTTLKAGDFALVPATMDASSRLVKPADAKSQWLEIRVPA
jgi:mannose-6-phosphate isomerase